MLIHDLKRRVVLHPDDPGARYALGEALFLENQTEPAIRELEKALALAPDHGDARRLLARAYRRDGRTTLAERTLVEAVRRAPEDPGARDELADVLVDGGRLDDALLHLEEALVHQPDDLSRRVRAADLARRRHLPERARRHLERARKLAPTDGEVARLHADILLELGEAACAVVSPLHRGPEFLLGRARAAIESRDLRESLAGALAPAARRIREGDLLGAKRALVTTAAAEQTSPGFLFLRAEVALLSGDLERARAGFRRAVEAAPQLALAWSRLGELESARGQHDDAIACWRELCALVPADPDAHEGLADALVTGGRPEEAIASYDRALERRPDPIVAAKAASLRANRAPRSREGIGAIGALAWNAFGGVVSRVEAVGVKGKGELVLSGNVARTGQEAARVAHSCLKARAQSLGLESALETCDLHVHFVDTELEKDGPSAGLAIALALVSALSRRPLRPLLAASGEITLHGAVRAVGGLHEKLVAAYLYGITTVILPRKNLFEARELPKEVATRVTTIYVDSLAEALEHAFVASGVT